MGFSRQEYWSGVPLPSLPQWASRPKFDLVTGREQKEACIWILLDSAGVFPHHDLAVYPCCITVIILSDVCNCLMSPSSECVNGLGDPSAQVISTGILHPQALI